MLTPRPGRGTTPLWTPQHRLLPQIPESCRPNMEEGIGLFSSLLNNRHFLIVFVHALEQQKDFAVRDRSGREAGGAGRGPGQSQGWGSVRISLPARPPPACLSGARVPKVEARRKVATVDIRESGPPSRGRGCAHPPARRHCAGAYLRWPGPQGGAGAPSGHSQPRGLGSPAVMAPSHRRCSLASLLTIALHGKLEYYTGIMKELLVDLIDASAAKNPKLMLRRTESVVEKMLTNWMSICMYSCLRVRRGGRALPLPGLH